MSRQAVIVLIALGLASFAIGTEFTGLAAVLVPIERSFDTDLASAQWALNVVMITFAMSIVAGGRFADMFGRRRMFLIGTAFFALATMGAALAAIGIVLAFFLHKSASGADKAGDAGTA